MSAEKKRPKEVCPIHNRELDTHNGCIDCKGVPKKEDILADLIARLACEAQTFQDRIQWYSNQFKKTLENETWR